jgi:hypothetical protein
LLLRDLHSRVKKGMGFSVKTVSIFLKTILLNFSIVNDLKQDKQATEIYYYIFQSC